MNDDLPPCVNMAYCDLKFKTLETKMDTIIASVGELDKTIRNGMSTTMGELRTDVRVHQELHAEHNRDSKRQWGTIAFLILTIVAAAIGVWIK